MVCSLNRKRLNKKGDASPILNNIIKIIIVLASFILLTSFTAFTISKTDEKSQEQLCRGTLFLREESSIGVLGVAKIKTIPLDSVCYTFSREVPLTERKNTKDGVMRSIGDLAAKAWWTFGEGTYPDVFKTGWSRVGDKPCYVMYSFSIKDNSITDKGSGYVSGVTPLVIGNELNSFFDRTVYNADIKLREQNCFNKLDDDSDGFIDEKDINDCPKIDGTVKSVVTTDCESKGGICLNNSCDSGFKQYENLDWTCRNKDICCVSDSNSNTYRNYIQKGGGALVIGYDGPNDFNSYTDLQFIKPDKIDFKAGELYGVALVQPISIALGSGIGSTTQNIGFGVFAGAGAGILTAVLCPPCGLAIGVAAIAGATIGGSANFGVDKIIQIYNNNNLDTTSPYVYIDRYDRMSKICQVNSISNKK